MRCQHEGGLSFVSLLRSTLPPEGRFLQLEGWIPPDRTSPSSSLPPLLPLLTSFPHPLVVIPMPITSFPPLLTSCILLPSFLRPLTSCILLQSLLCPSRHSCVLSDHSCILLPSFPPLLTSFPRRRESNPLRPTRIHTPPRKGGRGHEACCHAKRISRQRISRQMDYPHSAWLCYNWNSHDSSGT